MSIRIISKYLNNPLRFFLDVNMRDFGKGRFKAANDNNELKININGNFEAKTNFIEQEKVEDLNKYHKELQVNVRSF